MALVNTPKTMLSTVACYDAWSDTYDSDGNVLQLLDNAAFEEVAQPRLQFTQGEHSGKVCCELGCGTGRNTVKVLAAAWSVVAVDVSASMMAKAQDRVQEQTETQSSSISWIIYDLNSDNDLSIQDSSMDAVISTLVIEHIASLDRFFEIIYRLLKKSKDSWAFVTAMHPNMYRAGSQAGFIDETTGQKLCGVSFDHSIDDITQAATRAHLVLTQYSEKAVESEEHASKLGTRAKKWIGTNIHASFLFQLEN